MPARFAFLNAAADPVTLTLYNGQHAATGIAIAKAFQDKTGIQVKIRKGGDGQLASQITEEGARSPADVLYTEESPPLIRLASAGLLAKLEPETLALVEPEHAGGNGDWIGITARTRVLAYNPKKIDEKDLPKSLMDLSDPSWSGRFGFVPTSGAFLEQVAAVIKLKGQEEAEDWLTGLKAFGSIYTNNVTAMKAVENGEVDMALINNYYWYTLKKEKGELNSRLHYFGNGTRARWSPSPAPRCSSPASTPGKPSSSSPSCSARKARRRSSASPPSTRCARGCRPIRR